MTFLSVTTREKLKTILWSTDEKYYCKGIQRREVNMCWRKRSSRMSELEETFKTTRLIPLQKIREVKLLKSLQLLATGSSEWKKI